MAHLRIRLLREPGIEVTDETTKLSRYISALLNFARTPLVPLLRGAGGFADEGLNYSAHNTYSLLIIHHSLFIGAVMDRPFLPSPA